VSALRIKTAVDLELRNCLGNELKTLKEYEEMFDCMTAEEKDGLREWMAYGNSVNSNPHLLYGENGCMMDFIAANRIAAEMDASPQHFRR
jgi:hypothetical protein